MASLLLSSARPLTCSKIESVLIPPPVAPKHLISSKVCFLGSEEAMDGDLEKCIPASLEVNLNHGTKLVSALSVDRAGARLVTGSVDYDVKLWDFAGMNSTLQSFRTIRPCER